MNDDDENDEMIVFEEQPNPLMRWLPSIVVVAAIGGFAWLAFYAYHSGSGPAREEDLLVVEADKTPMKEKPLDPGGMVFPNQDKTVFETFDNSQGQPAKVERVLPAPEEPMAPQQQAQEDPKNWVNEKLQETPPSESAAAQPDAADALIIEAKKAEARAKAKAEAEAKIATAAPVAPVTETPKQEGPVVVRVEQEPTPEAKPEAPPEPKQEAKKEAPVSPKIIDAKPAAGGATIQLGAYKSDSEAKDAWKKLQKKFPELSGRQPIVVKADLGEKGIYYRLRTKVADAKGTCAKLSAKGQACLVP